MTIKKYFKNKFKLGTKNNHARKINSGRGFEFDMKKKIILLKPDVTSH